MDYLEQERKSIVTWQYYEDGKLMGKLEWILGDNEDISHFFVPACSGTKKSVLSFLLGIESEKVAVACVRPVLFGNKENDFSCICDGLFYIS